MKTVITTWQKSSGMKMNSIVKNVVIQNTVKVLNHFQDDV